ncbi:MAG TPA: hypothetical protein VF160_01730 [Candidatus Dormibacteraeota bacterium]
MRLALGAALLVLTVAGCSADLPPILNPNLDAAHIAALPSHAGLRDVHYVSVFAGPDGRAYTQQSGTVQLQPVRALSQVISPGPGAGGFAPAEYREVNGVTYNQMLPGWSHPRWQAFPAAASAGPTGNPAWFDQWWQLGRFRIEGQEGSAVDRAWRLVAQQANMGPQATVRLWIRQRDGYPLQYRLTFVKGTTTVTFDRWNSGARVNAPAPADLLPPPANAPVAGQLLFSGGSLRVLSVDYAYHGSIGLAPVPAGSHLVGTEVYVDAPAGTFMLPDYSKWQLLDGAGNAYPAQTNGAYGGKGGGSDLLAFFTMSDAAAAPYTLHVVFTDIPGMQMQGVKPPPGYMPPPPKVVLDGLIKLT